MIRFAAFICNVNIFAFFLAVIVFYSATVTSSDAALSPDTGSVFRSVKKTGDGIEPISQETIKVDPDVARDNCVEVDLIEIQGADSIPESILKDQIRKFEGYCVGSKEIDEIIKSITSTYIKKGFVTSRAYIPEQNAGSGILTIVVIEGKISSIVDARDGKDLSYSNVFMIEKDSLLNMRDIEQGLAQINRQFGYQAKSKIKPAKEQGKSVVVIENIKSKKIVPSFALDNSGVESTTGKYVMTFGLGVNDLFGYNDALSLSYKLNTNYRQDKNVYEKFFVSYDIPMAYWNFGINFNSGLIHYILDRGVVEITNKKSDWELSPYAKKLLFRDSQTQIHSQVDLGFKSSRNEINGAKIDQSTYQRQYLKGKLSVNHAFKNQSYLSFSLSANQGLGTQVEFTDTLGRSIATPESFPDPYYLFFILDGSFMKPVNILGSNATLNLSLKAQKTADKLFSDDFIEIGGRSSVPGFSDDNLTSSSAMYFRSILDFKDLIKPLPFLSSVYIAINSGLSFSDTEKPFSDRFISSWSAGINLNPIKSLNISLGYSQAIQYPSFFKDPVPVFDFNMSYKF